MASIPCTIHFPLSSTSSSSATSSSNPVAVRQLRSRFLGGGLAKRRWRSMLGSKSVPCNAGWGAKCWFRFGKDAKGAGIYGSQSRDDFDRDDVEQYFNYMGMLAVEGTYDKMEALLKQNIHPVDILLMLAASEGDAPKIEELLRAGAKYDVKDADGRTALDRAPSDEIKELIQGFSVQNA